MVTNLNTAVIYCGILTREKVGLNYRGIFITLAPGATEGWIPTL